MEAEAQLLIDKNLHREGEIAFELERSEQRRIVAERKKAMEEEYDDLRRALEVQKAVSREEMAKRARQAEEEFAETKRQLELQKAISREEMAKRAREAEAEFEAAKAKADEEYKKEMLRGQAQLDELIRKAEPGNDAGLEMEEEVTCVCCYSDFTGFVDPDTGISHDGVSCLASGDRHFLCNECFKACVNSSITDTPAKQDMREGKLACAYR